MTQRSRATPPVPAPSPEVVRRLVQDVQQRLRGAATEQGVAEARRNYGPEVRCYGVTGADVHRVGMEMVRQMRTGGLALALEVAEPLWRSGMLEEGLVAAQVVGAMGRYIGGEQFEPFERWAATLTAAATADGLATQLIARTLTARPSLVNRLREWTHSPNPFLRRAAVMSFVPMVREGRFLTDALSVIAQVMTDEDPQVQEGAGLVLMEASRLQEGRVLEFLRPWKGKSPRRLLARAAQKLTAAQRAEVLSD